MLIYITADQVAEENSGMGRYAKSVVLRLVPILIENGWRVRVIVSARAVTFQQEVCDAGAEIIPLTYDSKILRRIQYYLSLIRRKNEGASVVYSTDHNRPLLPVGMKSVITIHDLCGFECRGEYSWLKKVFKKYVVSHFGRKAEKVITISRQAERQILRVFRLPEERVSLVYNGFDKFSKPEQKPILEKKYFIFVGRISPRKNFTLILKALNRLREIRDDFELIVVGPEGWSNAKDFAYISENGLDKFIRFSGFVDDVCLASLYSGASALLFPSYCEGFGLPVLEALSMSTPVLVARDSACEEIAGGLAHGVQADDVSNCLRFMESALDGQVPVQRDHADQHLSQFSWDRCAREVLATIENL